MRSALVTCSLLVACTVGCTDSAPSYGDDPADPDLPPRGDGDLAGWIAAGHYLAWRCEPAPVNVRLGSPHRPQTRTCNNRQLLAGGTGGAGGSGELPVGAASVKELYDAAGQIMGYAVSRKVAAGGAEGWYWYEQLRGSAHADGMGPGAGSCTGCHVAAARDFTYVIVP